MKKSYLIGALAASFLLVSATQAASIPIPGYILLEEIAVPADGSSVFSTTVLANGETYKLQASGTHDIALGRFADAEYFLPSSGPLDFCVSGGCDYGIKINDPIVSGGRNTPFWGPSNASNIYEIDFVGLGAAIGINFHDDAPSDNVAGDLTLAVFAPVPIPSAVWLFGSGLVGLVGIARRNKV